MDYTLLLVDDFLDNRLTATPLHLHRQSSIFVEDLEKRKESAVRTLPSFIIRIFDFWRAQSPGHSPLRQNTPRMIPLDASCPCLSEKNYKDCCAERAFH